MVYEHVISRLKDVKGISHVYREGEKAVDGTCPAYTVGISVQAFKQGNQIYRSSLGPVGMFVGTTQVSFNFNLTDAAGNVSQKEQLKASIRMQSESITVADKFAKTLAKHYAASLHKEETAPQHTQTTPASSFR